MAVGQGDILAPAGFDLRTGLGVEQAHGQPMLTAVGCRCNPSVGSELSTVRQEFTDLAGPMCRKPGEHILQIGVRIVPVHTC